jgi:hypothetical protein
MQGQEANPESEDGIRNSDAVEISVQTFQVRGTGTRTDSISPRVLGLMDHATAALSQHTDAP